MLGCAPSLPLFVDNWVYAVDNPSFMWINSRLWSSTRVNPQPAPVYSPDNAHWSNIPPLVSPESRPLYEHY